MNPRKEHVKFGPVTSVLLLPLLFVAGALSIPYMAIAQGVVARRERRFRDEMKRGRRVMGWAAFIRALDGGSGTLIVERFSFEGPIRMWWTTDNLYDICPYPLVDWFTMSKDQRFDSVRDWCHTNYTGATGRGLLVIGDQSEWRTIRGDRPRTFREDVRYVEVPPPRK